MRSQSRPGGPWYPGWRYQVQTNLIDARFLPNLIRLRSRVQLIAESTRPIGYWGACRTSDRMEY